MRKLLGIFCLFNQFIVYSDRCVQLQDGCQQQRHHPIIVNILCISYLIDKGHFPICSNKHDGCQQKQQVAEQHDAAQASDGNVASIIGLQHLDNGVKDGSRANT